ncbi:hypothetical protein Tco_0534195 [Tanacetum coccineum]
MFNKCLNSAKHEMCVVNILSSVNATPTVKVVLNKGKQIWKPKGKLSDNSLNQDKTDQAFFEKQRVKLFGDIGYQWRPTGKKFTLGKLDCRNSHPLVPGPQHIQNIKRGIIQSSIICGKVSYGTGSDSGMIHFEAIMGYGDHVGLNKTVNTSARDNETEFVNQVMSNSISVGIYHQKSVLNELFKQTALSKDESKLKESLIHTRHNKTPYELVHDKKPDLTFLRVFGALCYPTNDSEDLGKFQAKADIGIFVDKCSSMKGNRTTTRGTRTIVKHSTRHSSKICHQTMLLTIRVHLNPVPFCYKTVNAQIVPPGTSLSTTIAQDAPSTSASSSTSDMHHPV